MEPSQTGSIVYNVNKISVSSSSTQQHPEHPAAWLVHEPTGSARYGTCQSLWGQIGKLPENPDENNGAEGNITAKPFPNSKLNSPDQTYISRNKTDERGMGRLRLLLNEALTRSFDCHPTARMAALWALMGRLCQFGREPQ